MKLTKSSDEGCHRTSWRLSLHVVPTCSALLLAITGCQQIGGLWSDSPNQMTSAEANSATARSEPDDLPPAESAEACIATAQELEDNGWDQEAITVYQRALKFDPERKGIAHRLALLNARLGKPADARKQFERAVDESPNDANVVGDFGYFLYEQRQYAAAETQLRKAISLAPKEQRWQVNLGMTLANSGQHHEALAVFEKCVGPAAARANLAVVLAQNGELDHAESMLSAARKIDPNIAQADVVDRWLSEQRSQEKPKNHKTSTCRF